MPPASVRPRDSSPSRPVMEDTAGTAHEEPGPSGSPPKRLDHPTANRTGMRHLPRARRKPSTAGAFMDAVRQASPQQCPASERRKIRVALYSDHNLLLTALAQTCCGKTGLDTVQTVCDQVPELTDWPVREDVDVVIFTVTVQESRLIGLLRGFRAQHPDPRILFIPGKSSSALARAAIDAGVDGYLPANASVDTLHDAVRSIAAGQRFIDASLAQELAFESSSANEALSPRERELLLYLAEGWRNRDVARHLNLSEKTVSTFRVRLKKKLGVQTQQELVAYARSHPGL